VSHFPRLRAERRHEKQVLRRHEEPVPQDRHPRAVKDQEEEGLQIDTAERQLRHGRDEHPQREAGGGWYASARRGLGRNIAGSCTTRGRRTFLPRPASTLTPRQTQLGRICPGSRAHPPKRGPSPSSRRRSTRRHSLRSLSLAEVRSEDANANGPLGAPPDIGGRIGATLRYREPWALRQGDRPPDGKLRCTVISLRSRSTSDHSTAANSPVRMPAFWPDIPSARIHAAFRS
jgi:hypothetical protein